MPKIDWSLQVKKEDTTDLGAEVEIIKSHAWSKERLSKLSGFNFEHLSAGLQHYSDLLEIYFGHVQKESTVGERLRQLKDIPNKWQKCPRQVNKETIDTQL